MNINQIKPGTEVLVEFPDDSWRIGTFEGTRAGLHNEDFIRGDVRVDGCLIKGCAPECIQLDGVNGNRAMSQPVVTVAE